MEDWFEAIEQNLCKSMNVIDLWDTYQTLCLTVESKNILV